MFAPYHSIIEIGKSLELERWSPNMLKYVITRIIFIFIILFLTISIMYIALQMAVLENLPHERSFRVNLAGVFQQYTDYIKGIFTAWDWGMSSYRIPAWDIVMMKVGLTLKLNGLAFVLYMSLGIGLGILTAVRKNTFFDRSVSVVTLFLSSIPSFVMILILMLYLGYRTNIFPAIYPIGLEDFSFIDSVRSLMIPIIALSLEPIAKFIRLVRGELIDCFEAPYRLLLTTKGLNKRQIIVRHHLKTSAVSLMPELAHTFMYVLFGSFFIELVFSMPGLARLFFKSLFSPFMESTYVNVDVNVAVLIAGFYTFYGLIANFFVDISYSLIDPRMKIGSKKTNL
jgi:oligopeptide transport system permease protein